ncbi:DNA replication factor Cdt1 isoform X2 [Stigmatopora nigra]
MSQTHVTDFFSQRKQRTSDSVKLSGASCISKTSVLKSKPFHSPNEDLVPNSPTRQVQDGFKRSIDAAAGLSERQSATFKNSKDIHPRYRTAQQISPSTELVTKQKQPPKELTIKKRRQSEEYSDDKVKIQEKQTRLTRRIFLPSSPKQQVPSGENVTSQNSIHQQIKKQALQLAAAPSVSSSVAMSAVTRAKTLAVKTKMTIEKYRDAEKIQEERLTAHNSILQPAYHQYHNLARVTPPGLSLPLKFKILGEMFRSMDTVVAMLFNRSETATFSKIRKGVQDMMHKQFDEHHIGQIKTVFPGAYNFRQETNIPTSNTCIMQGRSYQLTVEPVMFGGQKEGIPVLTASDLLKRRLIFHHNLISIVKHHHKLFLSLLVPQVFVAEDKLTRWHPNFNVDTLPAVQASLLPQPPSIEKHATAQEVLDKAHSVITSKMERALVSLVHKKGEEKEDCKDRNPKQASASLNLPNTLNGVSQSLLDRIRAKEAQKLQAAMTRSPSQEERFLMMSQLGELARILRNVFISEKKPALTMEVICNRMIASYRSVLTSGEMEKRVQLLVELNPTWLSIHPIRKDLYLKLNKHVDLSVILDKLKCSLREEEGQSATLKSEYENTTL